MSRKDQLRVEVGSDERLSRPEEAAGGLLEVWSQDGSMQRRLEQYPLGFGRKASGGIEEADLFELTTAMVNFYQRLSPEAARLAIEGGLNSLETFLDLNAGRTNLEMGRNEYPLMEALEQIGSGVAGGVEYRLCPTGEGELFSSKGFLLQDVVVEATGLNPEKIPKELRRFKPISPILVAQSERLDRGRLQIYKSMVGSFVEALNSLEAGLVVTADPRNLRGRDVRQNRKVMHLGEVLAKGGVGSRYDIESEEMGVAADMDTPLEDAFWYWHRDGSSSTMRYPKVIEVCDSGSGQAVLIPCRNKRGAANTVSDLTAVFYRLKKGALVVNLNRLNQMVVVLSNMVAGDLIGQETEDPKTAEQAVRVLHGSWVLALLTAWRKGYDEKMARLKLAGA